MNLFPSLRIGARLSLSFAILVSLASASTVLALWNARTANLATRELLDQPLSKERLSADLLSVITSNVARIEVIATSSDPNIAEQFTEAVAQSGKQGSTLVKQVQELIKEPAEQAMFDRIMALRKTYMDARTAVLKNKREGNAERAQQLLYNEMMPAAQAYTGKLRDFLTHQRHRINRLGEDLDAAHTRSTFWTMMLGALLVAASTVLAWRITRSITGPLSGAVDIAARVAQGDLCSRINPQGKDEVAEMMRSLDAMNQGLLEIVAKVKLNAELIDTSSREIADGHRDLAVRTERQAGSVEETAASIEQITATVRQSGEHAAQAYALSQNAASIASRGGEMVGQVVQTMQSIEHSSNKIGDIIAVIDGIAFQTNILALNAAVEAARAGEQGRGFAVVASEVRNLAQRAAAAAHQIKDLIEVSMGHVTQGAKLVKSAGATMEQVVESVARVNRTLADIRAASQEQAMGIEQIHGAMTEIDDVTQQNAALVEQAHAAASAMQGQAQQLAALVQRFQLPDQQAAGSALNVLRTAPASKAERPVAPARLAAPAKARRHANRGFTLIEIMVVVVIMGVLAALVVPKLLNRTGESKVAAAKVDIATVMQALKLYKLDNQRYPTSEQGLQALLTKPTTGPAANGWKAGGYLEKMPKDPWGAPYQYVAPGLHGEIDVISLGADGAPGGSGDDADIGSWEI